MQPLQDLINNYSFATSTQNLGLACVPVVGFLLAGMFATNMFGVFQNYSVLRKAGNIVAALIVAMALGCGAATLAGAHEKSIATEELSAIWSETRTVIQTEPPSNNDASMIVLSTADFASQMGHVIPTNVKKTAISANLYKQAVDLFEKTKGYAMASGKPASSH